MISTVIVLFSVLAALLFTVAYIVNPALRRKVEEPKYVFLRHLAQYDRQPAASEPPPAADVPEQPGPG